MVNYFDWIFNESLFKMESQQFALERKTRKIAEKSLTEFQQAWKTNRMKTAGMIDIVELRAVQAFNKIVFQQILGYNDLMSSEATYNLLPEVTFSLDKTAGKHVNSHRTDLAIGNFSVRDAKVFVITELKGPGEDLKKTQTGKGYRSKNTGSQLSAIDQAIETMNYADCEWALVSNMRDVILIHKSNVKHALHYDLSNLDINRLPELYYAFGLGAFLSTNSQSPRLNLLYDRSQRLPK